MAAVRHRTEQRRQRLRRVATLFLTPPTADAIVASLFGGNATFDQGAAIPWLAQAGWANTGSFEIRKYGSRLFLELNATNGAKLVAGIVAAQGNIPNLQVGPALPPVTFVPTVAPTDGEAYIALQQQIMRSIQSVGYNVTLTEDGTAGASFEVVTYGLDLIEEAFT